MSANRRTAKKQKAKINGIRRIAPLQTVSVVTPNGIKHLEGREITTASVGYKAYGLSTLTPGWTLPFFLVDAACEFEKTSDSSLPIQNLVENRASLQIAASELRLPADALVMVRSSGTAETMQQRGSLESDTCRLDQIAATISGLKKRLRHADRTEQVTVHWIVQSKVMPQQYGNLSNERRFKKEHRDWVAEYYSHENGPSQTSNFGIRAWRDGPSVHQDFLRCDYAAHLESTLKKVAAWGVAQKTRLHFEWVWDGNHVYMVQADECEDIPGVDPVRLVASQQAPPKIRKLKAFRLERKRDGRDYKKLNNSVFYRKLGYKIPPFYVLNNQAHIKSIIDGNISPELIADLEQLTQQPLVIRTDGTMIPIDKREMLPRSDELRSAEDAIKWLNQSFTTKIKNDNLQDAELCLLAHHYIPAVASAWVRAEPNKRMVRIESLWGIPEGLYWWSHDTFEVDTVETNPLKLTRISKRGLKTNTRTRYKGSFVAPDAEGKWVIHKTAAPFDWKRTINRQEWIDEIAITSRKIAAAENKSVDIMWFLDIKGTKLKRGVLPWFHTESTTAGNAQAAPRRKISSHKDFAIRSLDDWDQLRSSLAQGQVVNRVTVEPRDATLVRDAKFARDLAACAINNNFIIELSGGVLSHVFYILTEAGCSVECVDLYGTDQDIIEFNKIVRDQIPDQISGRGETADVVRLTGDALIQALKQKLVEEAVEVLDARSTEDLIAEIADVYEVINSICTVLSIDERTVESERIRKLKKRGGFRRGLMLARTTSPHTLPPSSNDLGLEPALIDSTSGSSKQSKNSAFDAHKRKLSMKPDTRTLGRAFEKMVTFETEFSTLLERKGSAKFSLPREALDSSEFQLVVELRRNKSKLRAVIKLVGSPVQFVLELKNPKN